MNKLYTAQEVADRLKIKKTTVYELIKRGELSSSKIGKQLRISEEQLAEYLKGTVSDSEQRPASPDFRPESSLLKREYLLNSSGLIISGQAPSVMELLMGQRAAHPRGLPILHSHMNSYNGLYSLYFGKVHAAAAGVFAEDITPLLPGIPLALLTLYEFTLGLYIKEGNPKDISGIQDLTRRDIILANREKGSTSRIYLDKQLKKMQIPASSISGYQKEFVSDFSAVAAVIDRHCDTAIGEKAVVLNAGKLDFIPLLKVPMYLVMEVSSLDSPGFQALIEITRSDEFKTALRGQNCYYTAHTGELSYL